MQGCWTDERNVQPMNKEILFNQVIHQYQFEVESWRRLLTFQKEELVFFKNRLAEVINSSPESDELFVVEAFQEEFLSQEKVIAYLSGELKRQLKLIEKELYLDGAVFMQMQREQKELRREFCKAEDLFQGIKNRFVQYLVDLY